MAYKFFGIGYKLPLIIKFCVYSNYLSKNCLKINIIMADNNAEAGRVISQARTISRHTFQSIPSPEGLIEPTATTLPI